MTYLKKERFFVLAFIFLTTSVMAHQVHVGWVVLSNEMRIHPPAPGTPYEGLFAPAIHSPEGYRIAIPFLAHLFMKVFHVRDASAVAGLFDFLAAFATCYLLYQLLFIKSSADLRMRALITGLFLAILQFPLSWVVPWQRPETLPSALFLAVCLILLTQMQRRPVLIVFIAIATLVQGFVRTDIPLILGVSILLMAWFSGAGIQLASRSLLTGTGVMIVGIDVAIQAYLQYVRFPGLTRWPGTRVVMLSSNLRSPHMMFNFLIAVLPFVVMSFYLLAKRPKLDPIDHLILLSSALYLVPFFIFGIIHEVRIFVPFMLCLSTVAAKVAAACLFPGEREDAGVEISRFPD